MNTKFFGYLIFLTSIFNTNLCYCDNSKSLQDLVDSYKNSPYPSFKVTNYFEIYNELFNKYRGKNCTFIEVGVLHGGSLFMWRSWLGEKARIIGIDLNKQAEQWKNFGFEIYIGDQGDPAFWKETFKKIGNFDVLLDDGGHQSFQQIVTLVEALNAIKGEGIVVIEDTNTSYMKEFYSRHRKHSFLQFSKDATDNLVAKMSNLWPNQFVEIKNMESLKLFEKVRSIEFFTGMVAFKINPAANVAPHLIWNHHKQKNTAEDYRYHASSSDLQINWPNPFKINIVTVKGTKK